MAAKNQIKLNNQKEEIKMTFSINSERAKALRVHCAKNGIKLKEFLSDTIDNLNTDNK